MIAVFAGTSDGKLAVDMLTDKNKETVCFNATPYGGMLYEGTVVYNYPMDLDMIKEKLITHQVTDIVDCTHPFAEVISQNLMEASEKLNIPYYRFERPSIKSDSFESYDDILNELNKTEGKIFLTIGSNNLDLFVKNIDLDRLYCRVLPTETVIQKCYELGFTPKQIIGMQGPFDEALNQAMFKSLNIKHMVTKSSGKAGGFKEKLNAAKALNIRSYVLGRPSIKYSNLYTNLDTLINEIIGDSK